jgi:hypothetical protein
LVRVAFLHIGEAAGVDSFSVPFFHSVGVGFSLVSVGGDHQRYSGRE